MKVTLATFGILIMLSVTTFGRQNIQQQNKPAISSSSDEDNLLKYLNVLTTDTEKHRAYLREYYQQLIWTITGCVTLFGGFLTIFGARVITLMKKRTKERFSLAFAELKTELQNESNLIKEEIKVDLVASSDRYKAELENIKAQLRAEHNSVKTELENVQVQLGKISQLYKDLKSAVGLHFEIKQSLNVFEYLKPDGSEVMIQVDQLISCADKDSPLAHRDHFMDGNENSWIEVLGSNPRYTLIGNEQERNKKGVRLHFDEPLTIEKGPVPTAIQWKIYNGYTKNDEYFTIFQRNENVQEKITFKFLLEKPYQNIKCEKINLFNEIESLTINPIVSYTATHQVVEIDLPIIPSGNTHKIIWRIGA
jgi:hypothetical protein